jgi:hypothetical protein
MASSLVATLEAVGLHHALGGVIFMPQAVLVHGSMVFAASRELILVPKLSGAGITKYPDQQDKQEPHRILTNALAQEPSPFRQASTTSCAYEVQSGTYPPPARHSW